VANADASSREAWEFERNLQWAEALAVYERLETSPAAPTVRLDVLLRKANALMELGRMEEARATFDVCIEKAKAIGDRRILARTLVGAGVYAANSGDLARAERFLLKALALGSEDGGGGNDGTAGWAMVTLGGLYGKTGRLDLAFVTLEKARERLAAVGNLPGLGAAWETQAQLRRAIGDDAGAREDLAEAVLLYRRAGLDAKARRIEPLLGRKLL